MRTYAETHNSLFYKLKPQAAVLYGFFHDNGFGELLLSEQTRQVDFWDYK